MVAIVLNDDEGPPDDPGLVDILQQARMYIRVSPKYCRLDFLLIRARFDAQAECVHTTTLL